MNKRKIGDLLIFLLVTAETVLILFLITLVGKYNLTPVSALDSTSSSLPEYTSLLTLNKILKDFANSHTYISSSEAREMNVSPYMCLNFSHDLIKELAKQGYKGYVRRGCAKSRKGCHAWVELHIEIEPMLGYIANNYSAEYPRDNRLIQ